eukprot:gene30690-34638_t
MANVSFGTRVSAGWWTWLVTPDIEWLARPAKNLNLPLLIAFFTCVGLGAPLRVLLGGGRMLLVLLLATTALAALQNAAGVAVKTVSERVEKITNDFFSELLAKNSNGVAQAQDPDFQYVFLQAQTSYARSGAADLEQLLVDLLVDRIGAAERDILQIVLNESLATVSKLTDSHIATLAVAFFFQHVDCRPHGLEQFGTSLDDVVERHRHSQIIWSRYCVSAWRDYLCKALLPNFFVHEA